MMTTQNISAQSELYPQHFDLNQVTLLDGPMKTSLITNSKLLLSYDADRLMAPFIREAELDKKNGSKYYGWTNAHPSFPNWGQPDWTLEGHVGGHYLSALALAYASLTDNSQNSLRNDIKSRLDYCIGILKDCQEAYANNNEGLKGFLGGQPIRDAWKAMYKGDAEPFYKVGGWVPFYCEHKVLAGLRDAYIYAGDETAKTLYKNLCDWSINLVSKLSQDTMQRVLGSEHGGINETLADAYKIFGEVKYLNAAKKFSHTYMLDGMQSYNTSFLNDKHANTQVPKYIGFERIYQLQKTSTNYHTSAVNFWKDVNNNRTVCIGGNSVNEHFLNQSNYDKYISQPDGPETCNSNNMLKLSEDLFDDTHDSQYADFYENTMYNHILSTQDPKTGGYVYFTTLRPQGYKIYSKVNQGMWCCVGTGMENHGKYGHFIYTHDGNNTLYINLFTASELKSDNFAVRQETSFPYEEQSNITVNKSGNYAIAIRKPNWVTNGFDVKVNGVSATGQLTKGYFIISRNWNNGDKININLPMTLRYEQCPGLSDYIAFKYGPILLAGNTEATDLQNEYGGEGRMDHSPGCRGTQKSINSSPLLICNRDTILNLIKKNGTGLSFTINAPKYIPVGSMFASKKTLKLEPFFSTHHTRYVIYWYQATEEDFIKSDIGKAEAAILAMESRTIDFVGTGEQQSEAGHKLSASQGSTKGSYNGEFYRDAPNGGYIQYTLSNKDGITSDLSIMCRFTTADKGRIGAIYVEGKKLSTFKIPESYTPSDNGFFNYEIPIPDELLIDGQGKVKSELIFRIKAEDNTICPGLYYLRLLKDYSNSQAKSDYKFLASEWATTGDESRVVQSNISYNSSNNSITVNSGTGNNNVCLKFSQNKYNIVSSDRFLIIRGTNLSTSNGSAYLWWYNGTCHGTSIAPIYTNKNGNDVYFVWDLPESGLMDNSQGDDYAFSKGNTIFGLTSTTGTSIIKDITFSNSYETYIASAISTPTIDKYNKRLNNLYKIDGTRYSNLDSVSDGIYIVNGKKVLIK
ncbi:MAG: glycoside hydrolase family 127 protein [Bacteroidaceae bacterium]|nr:glycoside hydrolase family 127 protein [Bacteroidaceae bacterium]